MDEGLLGNNSISETK